MLKLISYILVVRFSKNTMAYTLYSILIAVMKSATQL